MRFEKTLLTDDLPGCYAVAPIKANGRLYYILASDEAGACIAVDAKTGSKQTIWSEPGGTMSIVPLPGTDGEFLISQKFLPGFHASDSRIMRVRPCDGGWDLSLWLELPYVHRFDILPGEGGMYFLGCILTTATTPEADWNYPGTLVAARLDADYHPPERLEIIADGMTRNHGYWRMEHMGGPYAYTACDEGVFRVTPPRENAHWKVESILRQPASDIALCDIDSDGVQELAVISPFHGNQYSVYRLDGTGRELYRHETPADFYHVIWGGTIAGRPAFLGGYRALGKELFLLSWENGTLRPTVIERGAGPSNVSVFEVDGITHILAANHEAGEGALYRVYLD